MNENLEQRKEKAKELIKVAYAVIDKKWYQVIPTYRLIPESLENKSEVVNNTEEIIIRNDTKGALGLSAFFVLLGFLIYLYLKEDAFGHLVMLAIWMCFILKSSLDKRPKIILNNIGFWGYNFENVIPWENIFAIYLKTEETSDDKKYSLMIHYYDDKYDYFREIEFELRGFEKSEEEIIELIKQFY
jgi:hypothetical protein